MRNLLSLPIVALALVSTLVACSGKTEQSGLSTTGDGKPHHKEPVPVNRFPMAAVNARTIAGQPAAEVVQSDGGKEYGIRPFASEEKVRNLIKPGDVAIYYNPLTKTSTPMNIVQLGMFHAATVVYNRAYHGAKKIQEDLPDEALCFVHAGQGADCDLAPFTHFFRVNHDDPQTSAMVAELAGKTIDVIKYDASFTTEILNNNNTLDKATFAEVKEGKVPDSYCSELPYTLHSVFNESPLFGGRYVSDIVTDYKKLRERGTRKFTCDMGTESSVDSLMQYLGQFDLNFSKLQKSMLRGAVSQYLADNSNAGFSGYLRGGALAGIDWATGRKVMPADFVMAFHANNQHLTYIGSWEANATPKEDQCGAPPNDNANAGAQGEAEGQVAQ